MPTKIVGLQFPLKGLDRGGSFQKQPPYSTVDALNVRPRDCILGRMRGGSRPGTGKVYSTDVGDDVNMMSSVSWVSESNYALFFDNFDGDELASYWVALSGENEPLVADDVSSVSEQQSGKVLMDAPSGLDTSKAYTIGVYVLPYSGEHWGEYEIFGKTVSDPYTDGFSVKLEMNDDTGDATLTLYDAGTQVATGTYSGDGAVAGLFEVVVNGSTVDCYWNMTKVCSGTVAATGSKMGFGMNCLRIGGMCIVDAFRARYYKTTNKQARANLFVCSSNGTLYKEDFGGVLTAIASDLTINSDIVINAQERLQKLYIADYGDINVKGDDGSMNGGELTATGVSDWTTYGIDEDDCVVTISNGTGTVVDGTYEIASVTATSVTLTSSIGTGSCSYKIQRGPKVFNPADDSLSLWMADTGKGAVPPGCELICLYRDRMVLAGENENSHLWYMSRQGDPNDWDYGQTDAGRAIAGQNSDAGIVGEPINALIPHSYDYLLFGCENSLWILRGDPGYGGFIDAVSRKVGVVGANAWCKGPHGETVFLSKNGLYMLPPSAQGTPEPLSYDVLPRELMDIGSDLRVSMSYDLRFKGVHIYIEGGGVGTHWWFDWETRGFWRVKLPYEIVTTYEYYSRDAGRSLVMLGCSDGYVRMYDERLSDDDGTDFESYVKYGPINIGGVYYDGVVSELICELGEKSGDVRWDVYVGETAESVSSGTSFANGVLSEGLNYKHHPRARGGSMILKLSSNDHEPWAVERVTMLVERAGSQRRL